MHLLSYLPSYSESPIRSWYTWVDSDDLVSARRIYLPQIIVCYLIVTPFPQRFIAWYMLSIVLEPNVIFEQFDPFALCGRHRLAVAGTNDTFVFLLLSLLLSTLLSLSCFCHALSLLNPGSTTGRFEWESQVHQHLHFSLGFRHSRPTFLDLYSWDEASCNDVRISFLNFGYFCLTLIAKSIAFDVSCLWVEIHCKLHVIYVADRNKAVSILHFLRNKFLISISKSIWFVDTSLCNSWFHFFVNLWTQNILPKRHEGAPPKIRNHEPCATNHIQYNRQKTSIQYISIKVTSWSAVHMKQRCYSMK